MWNLVAHWHKELEEKTEHPPVMENHPQHSIKVVNQSFQKSAQIFCDCCRQKSVIIFRKKKQLKMQYNMRDISAIVCNEIAKTCKACGKFKKCGLMKTNF